ncbi:MAG TPA: PaaI family thioesterase [Chloroflexia bacterium]|nr:PaaI family thioesterase [Chloroflexia bacterium]
MDTNLEFAEKALASQPFSRLIGAKITAFSPELSELIIPIRDELKQQHGFVHGGVLSYAADNALTFAGGAALGAGVLTSEFKINYLRPAVGETLIARASVIYAGKSQAVCRCDIFAVKEGEEKLCATAQGTIFRKTTSTGDM